MEDKDTIAAIIAAIGFTILLILIWFILTEDSEPEKNIVTVEKLKLKYNVVKALKDNNFKEIKKFLEDDTYLSFFIKGNFTNLGLYTNIALNEKNKDIVVALLEKGFYFNITEDIKNILDWIFENISEELLIANIQRAAYIEENYSDLNRYYTGYGFYKIHYDSYINGYSMPLFNKYEAILKIFLKEYYKTYKFTEKDFLIFLSTKDQPGILLHYSHKNSDIFSNILINLSNHVNDTDPTNGRSLLTTLLHYQASAETHDKVHPQAKLGMDWYYKISVLCSHSKVDMFIKDINNNNVLHYAASVLRPDILARIIETIGQNVTSLINEKNSEGQTPLHKAALKNNKIAIQVLLETGADPNLEDAKGMTPKDLSIIMNTGINYKQ